MSGREWKSKKLTHVQFNDKFLYILSTRIDSFYMKTVRVSSRNSLRCHVCNIQYAEMFSEHL